MAADCNSEPLGINLAGYVGSLVFLEKTASLPLFFIVISGVELAGALGFDLSSMEKR